MAQGLDDAAVQKQLNNMVSFIRKEAEEKAAEIIVLAEEEFTIEKAKLVQSQKLKLMKEFERKEKQVDVTKKIIYSNELNRARLEKLRAQQKEVSAVLSETQTRLGSIASGAGYKELVASLILQGLVAIDEANVLIRCRAEDFQLVKDVIPSVSDEYTKLTSKKVALAVDTAEPVTCAGGVILSALEGRILANNTLDARLHMAYETALPKIRTTLFGAAAADDIM